MIHHLFFNYLNGSLRTDFQQNEIPIYDPPFENMIFSKIAFQYILASNLDVKNIDEFLFVSII
jgi:hypothetical protein